MATEALEAVRNELDAHGLLDGLSVRYFRWTDTDLNQGADLVAFVFPGTEGPSDTFLQQPDVDIVLLKAPQEIKAGADLMGSILSHLRTVVTPSSSAARFQPLSWVQGPIPLDDGRMAFRLSVRVYMEAA